MDPITGLVAVLGPALWDVAKRLLEEGVVDPALEPAIGRLKARVQRPYREAEKDEALRGAIKAALEAAGAPTDDPDDLVKWLQQVGLRRLQAERNDALRRRVARGVLAFTDPEAGPPEDLLTALRWPRDRKGELAALLATLRAELAALDAWRPLIEYADRAVERGLLRSILDRLNRMDTLILPTEAGAALRVALVPAGLAEEEAVEIEARYREEVARDLYWHDFRGIIQTKQAIRLPLEEIYLELGLLSLEDEAARRQARERWVALSEPERLAEEERRLQERVTDALARHQRLVILGEPGAGKTISLCFIALMLAQGHGGARLGLDAPYLPLRLRLADYARALKDDPVLSLHHYLLDYVGRAYDCHPRLPDLLHRALEAGVCMVLLDGLDEVGDDPVEGRALRRRVVEKVQQFADRWCTDDLPNRLVVTSRIEGYREEPVRGFTHVELSPLRPPDEIEAFLLRWYTAHELQYGSDPAKAGRVARERVDELLPRILEWPSIRRLATNPLLLTILALIHENVGKLPNRRIKLYEICAQTLIESWRQAQTGMPSQLLAELEEETVVRVMAQLAYWLHEHRPGGTAPFEEWKDRLGEVLQDEGFEEEAEEITRRFLHHARHEAGLLAERGPGEYGFFHLTFEEYLAAREMARQRVERRREMLRAHWEDPRWHEVILLAAGQLGIVEARRDDVSDFLEDLLKMEPAEPENAGRQAILAGRALADIGPRSVTPQTRRWVQRALQEVMQDLDPDTGKPHIPPRLPIHTRYGAGEVLDELGWLPDDLDRWLRCEGCAEGGGDLMAMKYPVTNVRFERFIRAGGYETPAYWSEAGWRWRVEAHPDYRGEGPVTEPEYWHHPRFGQERRGYPVVGVSWYEAEAYCRWLTDLLRRVREGDPGLEEADRALVADLVDAGAEEVRLPTKQEWVAMAGGEGGGRYPWDPPGGPATEGKAAVVARANVGEAGLGGTSPVGMYPLGASHPFGLVDLAGNVWEWTVSPWEPGRPTRVVRGGSWFSPLELARCAERDWGIPDGSSGIIGFRCVSPIPCAPP